MPGGAALLEVLGESGEVKEKISLANSPVTVGRLSTNDIVLGDANVSRRHAELRSDGDRWVLTNLGSTNGSLVNRRRTTKQPLSDDDKLTFGLQNWCSGPVPIVAVSNELAARLERGTTPAAESLAGLRRRDPAWSRRQVCAWYLDKPLPLCNEANGSSLTKPSFVNGKFRDIVRVHDELHLRVSNTLPVGSSNLTVVTSEPFDKDLVGKIASNLGEITLYKTGLALDESTQKQEGSSTSAGTTSSVTASATPEQNKGGIVITSGKQGAVQADRQVLHPTFTVGALPASTGSFDREITFGTPLAIVDWKTGEQAKVGALLQVTTRPTILYGHLFAALGEFVRGVAYILIGVGIFFAIIELIALIIGTRMTRR